MAEEGVSFDRVTRIYREEKGKSTLTKLEADFYPKLNAYIEDLKSRAESELAQDPHSSKAILLQDELRKIAQKRDQIYKARERKIVIMASAHVGGTEVDPSLLAKNEKDLFELLVEHLKRARLELFSGRASSPREAKAEPEQEQKEEEPPQPRKEGGREAPEDDMAVIQVLEDIPPFAGIDVNYELKKEEVVTLPRSVARILSQTGKIKLLEIGNP